MESVKTMIDKGAESCGTKRKLAARLEMTEQNLQGVYAGRRHFTCEQAIGLARIIGEEPAKVWAMVSVEREANPEERGRLKEAFFPRGIAGAVVIFAICLASATDRAEAASVPANSQLLTKYTLSV